MYECDITIYDMTTLCNIVNFYVECEPSIYLCDISMSEYDILM